MDTEHNVQQTPEIPENKNMKVCKHCGATIAANAKVCPKCGGKNKKPIYQRVWFIVLVILILLGVIGSLGSDDSDSAPSENVNPTATTETAEKEEPISFTPVDVATLSDALEKNALNASNTYKGQYVSVTGKLGNIDSDGSYISLDNPSDSWDFTIVQCFIRDDAQLDIVNNLSTDDTVTVNGKVTEVGEIMGYNIDIMEIIPQQ